MIYTHDVTLTLRSTQTQLNNFDEYQITLDMFQPGQTWGFSLWYSGSRESTWRRMLAETRLGDTVELSIDGALQLNGRVEKRDIVVSRDKGAALVISGRDLAGPAMDWDANPGTRLYKRALKDALEDLFKPLDIPVVIGANADAAREVQSRARRGSRGSTSEATVSKGRHHRKHTKKKVDLSHPKPGERVWQVMDSILRKMGFMAWVAPAPDGQLAIIIDVPNYDQDTLYTFHRRLDENGQVTLDSNIIDSHYECQIRDIPTVVWAYGRAPRGDQKPSRHGRGVTNGTVFRRPMDHAEDAINNAMYLVLPTPPGAEPLVHLQGPLTTGQFLTQAVLLANQQAEQTEIQHHPEQRRVASVPTTARMPFRNDGLQDWPIVVSPLPPQPRFLHTKRARNPETGQQEARRVIAEAMRRFRQYKITVQGHGQMVDGHMRTYAINTMAKVYDRLSELGGDEEMLITRVTFERSRKSGTLTHMTLGHKGAVILEPSSEDT